MPSLPALSSVAAAAVAGPSAAAAAPAWAHAAELDDIDELAAAQAGWELRYEQLSQGRFKAAVRHVQLPDLRLVRETASQATRQRGQIGGRHIGFAICDSPAGDGYFHGQRIDGESILIGRGDDLDLTLRQDSLLIAIVVDADLLSSLWQQLYDKPWSTWLDHKVVVQARPRAAGYVRAAHSAVLEAIAAEPSLLAIPETALQLRDNVLVEWLEAIPSSIELCDLHSVAARRRIVDRACELVLGTPDRPLTTLEVCKQIGTSPRKLELCFRDVLGLSPHKYLRAVRLCGARRDLKRMVGADVTVHDIAARWGFWHMSAFSAEYKRQFGELPSTTQRQSGCASIR
jgi:AraC family ethanolamine operon transcriptional activator